MTQAFVGVFDSGLGGISVLRELVRELPYEVFYYFGDSANAPYGEKSPAEVLALSTSIVERMIADGAKAIVIACNTATSVAASELRQTYQLPIVGVEPALKPACEAFPGGRILVMATPITLKLEKFHQLEKTYGQNCSIELAPCPGLAARIEQGNLDADDLHEFLESLVGSWAGAVDGVVLGCTHYSFVREQIRSVLGNVPFFDGAAGTARQTRALLTARGLLASENDSSTRPSADSLAQPSGSLAQFSVDLASSSARQGSVSFASSLDTPETLALYQRFFEGV